mgnify:CR=1 FL=1
MDYISHYTSPLGDMTMASDGEALCGLWFDGGRYFGDVIVPPYEEKELSIFDETKHWLDVYFGGSCPDFTPQLAMRNSDFGQAVCSIMLAIPYGETMTYGQIAEMIAEQRGLKRMSAQAIGGAVGRNPVSIIIPCHRVVGTSGSLTGYGGGLDRKVKLLELEGADMKDLFMPKEAKQH